MEQIAGSNNWKLVIRREVTGITILHAQTCDKRAALPEKLFGLPVTALAHHALTPGRTVPVGEEVLVTCSPAVGDWDNGKLEELHLPDTLTHAGDYAFYNCGKLKTLHLSDSLRHWGGGALINCRSLDTFCLRCSGQEGEVLACLADELPRELDVTLLRADGQTARLIFPEYAETYEENVPHHQFDFHLEGAGYPYHHCFYQKKFNLRDYDELWRGYLAMGHDEDCAMRLAWWRLRCPVDLAPKAEEQYWSHLRACRRETACWRLAERDAAGLRFLLAHTEWERQELTELSALARDREDTELMAVLLEEQHRRFPAGLDRTFDL